MTWKLITCIRCGQSHWNWRLRCPFLGSSVTWLSRRRVFEKRWGR